MVIPFEQREVIQASDDLEILVKITCERQRIYVLMSPIPEGYELRAVERARSRMHGKFRRNRSLLFVRKNQHPAVDSKSCRRRTVNPNVKAKNKQVMSDTKMIRGPALSSRWALLRT